MSSTNVLGESRPIAQTWPDGTFTCPWCGAAVLTSDRLPCPNPACEAHPNASAAQVLKRRAETAKRSAEREQRRHDSERRAEMSRRWAEDRRLKLREVQDAGHCARCFVSSGDRKLVRHRAGNAEHHAR